jgi:cell wall-associated NlpC family hydrolase
MTSPPTSKHRSLHSLLLLTAPLLALCLHCSPARANIILGDENPQDLSQIDAVTVPTLPERVAQVGMQAIGTPYRWGGDDPDEGFDCSGLVSFVFRETAGVDLPRTAREQIGGGRQVARALLQVGDLVFFRGTTRATGSVRVVHGRRVAARPVVSHVGIYIGGNRFVHAPSRGESVRVDSLAGYWAMHFAGARRYIEPSATRLAGAGQP